MNSIFGPEGLLAARLPGYESRPGQLEMARAVEALLAEHPVANHTGPAACLAIEAETGLGKTLAYLVPAVLSGNRVVISTNTRNLQDQILTRELPLIRRWVDPELKALAVKGRQNYLCLHRWRQLQASRQPELFDDSQAQRIERWLNETVYGDRSELDWLAAASPLWQKICCHSHLCAGTDCSEAGECLLNRLRRDAAACRLLVVNHHLLFSDLAVRRTGFGEVLPRYETVIFDEAHHVEQIATTFFGFTFSLYQIFDLLGDVERAAEAELGTADQQLVRLAAARLAQAADQFADGFPGDKGRFPLQPLLTQEPHIHFLSDALQAALDHLGATLESILILTGLWPQYSERVGELAQRLASIMAHQYDDLAAEDVRFTHWYERTDRNLSLFATPVDVAPDLRSTLFATAAHCIFASATLTTGGNFQYFLQRLGLPEQTPTLSLASPFDYRNQTLLYIPEKDFPEPAGPGYLEALQERMHALITSAGGRTLVLFTSVAAMEQTFRHLRDRLPFPLLIQGEAPRRALLTRFSRETASVLFAVASFWEGVDIPGESLSLVIIDKLPFEVPSDPVIMARVNRIKALGGNPFFDFQVPRAILALRQGVGRLMRTSADRGVIALLDTRLFTKGYGRLFVKSLPASPLTRDLGEVAAFFGHLAPPVP